MTAETPEQPRTQDVVEQVDDHLKAALEQANRYCEHDEVRPSAIMAFNEIEQARNELDKIDKRDFNGETE